MTATNREYDVTRPAEILRVAGDLRPTLKEIEKAVILERLALYKDATVAARSLMIGRTSIYRKMRQYGIPVFRPFKKPRAR